MDCLNAHAYDNQCNVLEEGIRIQTSSASIPPPQPFTVNGLQQYPCHVISVDYAEVCPRVLYVMSTNSPCPLSSIFIFRCSAVSSDLTTILLVTSARKGSHCRSGLVAFDPSLKNEPKLRLKAGQTSELVVIDWEDVGTDFVRAVYCANPTLCRVLTLPTSPSAHCLPSLNAARDFLELVQGRSGTKCTQETST